VIVTIHSYGSDIGGFLSDRKTVSRTNEVSMIFTGCYKTSSPTKYKEQTQIVSNIINKTEDHHKELPTAHIQNKNKQNTKAGTGMQTTEVSRSWT
jgi:hypothetical protein